MFSITRITQSSHKVIALVLAAAVVLWSLGFHVFTKQVSAANVTNFSDVLSDSDLSVDADHLITFTTPNGMLPSSNFVITFPVGFDLTDVDEDDIDLTDDAAEQETAGAASATEWGIVVAGQDITFTAPSGVTVGSSSVMQIEIGSNADHDGATGDQINNPGTGAPTSYEIDLSGTIQDSGHTRVVILDDVLVTAQVDTVFDFTVTGFNAAGTAINGTTTNGTTTSTLIDFGTLTAGEIETRAQLLNVQTNAANGFSVTIEQDGDLDSSTGAIIDPFIDGLGSTTAQAWQAPAETIGDLTTYGHWGITSSDETLTDGDVFGNNLWLAASTTPDQVFFNNGPADNVTEHVGSTTVGFQVEITPLQEAGDDYDAVLTYIATPTF